MQRHEERTPGKFTCKGGFSDVAVYGESRT